MNYIDNLIENCKLAKEAKPIREFTLENIDQLNGISNAIYIIEEIDGNPDETFLSFSRFKQLRSHACARLNAPSSVLYVGSSSTNLRKRILEHLGEGNSSTYSLHLKHWFSGNYRITIKMYDQPAQILQIIEDALGHELHPAFGKLGSNNK